MLLLVYLQSHRSASFETAVEMGEQLAQQGREDIPACTGCHGGSGEGNRGLGYPRLAGLHPDYIRKQLRDFARNPLDIGVKVEPRVSLPTELIAVPVVNPGEYYVPPKVEDIPDDKYGDMVRWGREIFVNIQVHGRRFVGNGLNCSSCHLSEGRQPYAMPLWAAYGMYPQYRSKNREVITIQERIQDCFRYSLDGIAPTLDTLEMEALVTYMHWLSKDVPIGVELPGRGLAPISRTRSPSHINGEIVYKTRCAMCHGEDGKGQKHKNGVGYMFPPLWGGIHSIVERV